MTIPFVKFTDPSGSVSAYTWPRNPEPDGVTPAAKARQITRTSNTANVGATRQQGDDGSYIIQWALTVISDSDFEKALWKWYVLCERQTIYLKDMRGAEYEGQITGLSLQEDGQFPIGVARYQFTFEVWVFRSGILHDAGVLT